MTMPVPLNTQQNVEQEAAKWGSEWIAKNAPEPMTWPEDLGERMPELRGAAIREAALTFP